MLNIVNPPYIKDSLKTNKNCFFPLKIKCRILYLLIIRKKKRRILFNRTLL